MVCSLMNDHSFDVCSLVVMKNFFNSVNTSAGLHKNKMIDVHLLMDG